MPESAKPTLPSYPQLLRFFGPLALSNSMMTLEPLILITALSHALHSELTLAGYNVMFGIALVIEAPVIMLLSASTALSQTQHAFYRLFRFMLALGGLVVAIGFLVSLTPLYGWLVLGIMQIPPAVAEAARPALVIMSIWSFPVAWRRMLQGVLIAHNRTPIVTLATVVRLAALAAALFIGGRLMPDQMLIVAALAMQASVIAESLIVTPPAFGVVRKLPVGPEGMPLSWRGLFGFYQPLATMMVLRQISRPMLSAGIAAAFLPERSLAAWAVAWSLALLPFGVTLGLEQVAIAKGTSRAAKARVRRFVWGVGLTLAGVMVAITFTPLVHPMLEFLFDLSLEAEPMVVFALRWTAMLPLLQSLQGLLRGMAISEERTRDVRTAVGASLVVVALITIVGPRLGVFSGIAIGVLATMLSALAEVGWLGWRERRTSGG